MCTLKTWDRVQKHTSMENITPPIGDPNATATPAALAAVTTWRILAEKDKMRARWTEHVGAPWLLANFGNQPATIKPIQQATWTEGPSLPTDKPEAMTNGYIAWAKRKLNIWQSTYQGQALDEECWKAQKAFHSESCQYTLDLWYSWSCSILRKRPNQVGCHKGERGRTHHVNKPTRWTDFTPRMPGVAGISLVFSFNFPATKLLIKPPSISTIAHLDVGKPFGDDGYNCCVQSNAYSYNGDDYPRLANFNPAMFASPYSTISL